MARAYKQVHRELTADERRKVEETRLWVKQHADEICELARMYRNHSSDSIATLEDAVELLKAERIRQQLSLGDIDERVGIGRPNLSRLENDAEANPTVATLVRYAEALGKRLLIVLEDESTHDAKAAQH